MANLSTQGTISKMIERVAHHMSPHLPQRSSLPSLPVKRQKNNNTRKSDRQRK